jgi:methyl coenzyme M reductase beta subunit
MESQQIVELLLSMQARMDSYHEEIKANRQAVRELLVGIMDANVKYMREDIKCGQAEMRSILDAWMTDIKDARIKTTACQEVTGANPEKIELDSGNDAVRGGASRNPHGRSRSETGQGTEEAA